MKKLLIATDNFLPRWDGIARFLLEVVPKLSNYYDISILAPNYKGFNLINTNLGNAAIHKFDTFNFEVGDFPPAIPPGKKIEPYIKNADIVWVQTIGPIGRAAIKYAKKLDKPLISFNHSIEWELVPNALTESFLVRKALRFFVKQITKRAYNKCNLLIVPSQDTANKLRSAGIKRPMKQVNLGIDLTKFKPADRIAAKKIIGVNTDSIVISYIGRLGREKDLVTLYRAFVQLSHKHKNAILLIVGEGIESYKKMFKRERMLFIGPRSDVEKFFQATDIYVLPSMTETTSLTTMEAMACGCAVLTTRTGAIPTYVVNKYNGMFFPKRNSYVLRRKLELLIENNELRDKLGENARKTIEAQQSWDKTVEGIKEILDKF